MSTQAISVTGQDPLVQTRIFLERVLPWPPLGDPNAFFNIHFPLNLINDRTGKPHWTGRACSTLDETIKAVKSAMSWRNAIGDVYVCLSSQRMFEQRTPPSGYSYRKAIKSQGGVAAIRSLFLDIDVKPNEPDKAYASTQEAIAALRDFLRASGMPRPSLIVFSGTGGLHAYWTLTQALTRQEWQPYANALAELTRKHDLKSDTVCTIDSARVMRVPGTFNFKRDQPLPVTLAKSQGPDYELSQLPLSPAATLISPKPNASVSMFPGALDALAGGVQRESRPVVLDTVAQAGCGFIKDALDTGGKDYAEPLWHLTTLAAVFAENGREKAHEMAQGHASYAVEDTDALFDRKLKEREEKNLGWPSCRSIQNAGCKACATCPYLSHGKSPLHLGKTALTLQQPPPIPLRIFRLSRLAKTPPPRRWVHGNDALEGEVSLLVAPGGKGKSATLIAFALACASGRELLGQRIFGGPKRTVYINTEDDDDEITRRVRGAQINFGLDDNECHDLYVAGLGARGLTLLRSVRGEYSLDEGGWAALRSVMTETRPEVLILDPLANLSAHTLNDNSAAKALMAGFKRLAIEFNTAVIIAHHTSKGRDINSAEAAMGASQLVSSARVVINLETLKATDAAKIGVQASEAGRYFRLISTKANLSPPSSEDRWFELISVSLDNGTADYPSGDKVQVVVPYKPRPTSSLFTPGDVLAALKAISNATPPLSTSPNARNRFAYPMVAAAIGRDHPADEVDGRLLVQLLLEQALITNADVKISRGKRSGGNLRKGLILTDLGKAHLKNSSTDREPGTAPQSPQPALSAIEANEGTAARLALQGDASVAWGGMGGSEARDMTEAADAADD